MKENRDLEHNSIRLLNFANLKGIMKLKMNCGVK